MSDKHGLSVLPRPDLSLRRLPSTRANIASWFINLGECRMAHAAQGHNDFDHF